MKIRSPYYQSGIYHDKQAKYILDCLDNGNMDVRLYNFDLVDKMMALERKDDRSLYNLDTKEFGHLDNECVRIQIHPKDGKVDNVEVHYQNHHEYRSSTKADSTNIYRQVYNLLHIYNLERCRHCVSGILYGPAQSIPAKLKINILIFSFALRMCYDFYVKNISSWF